MGLLYLCVILAQEPSRKRVEIYSRCYHWNNLRFWLPIMLISHSKTIKK